jgi:hypothetical protein
MHSRRRPYGHGCALKVVHVRASSGEDCFHRTDGPVYERVMLWPPASPSTVQRLAKSSPDLHIRDGEIRLSHTLRPRSSLRKARDDHP